MRVDQPPTEDARPALDTADHRSNPLGRQKPGASDGLLDHRVVKTHEFDVGKYREETMAFPPGVTIKDYQSDISQGYPNPKPGGQPARFPTLIQIVPVIER